MKKLIATLTAFAMMTLLMVSSLTVHAKDTDSSTENTRNSKEEVERMLNGLEERPAGRGYPNDNYISMHYVFRLDRIDYDSLERELQEAVEVYNSCNELEIEAKISTVSEGYGEVCFSSKNLYYIEHTPIYIGQRAYVRAGKWKYWESSENLGSGKSGTIEAKEGEQIAVIVTGVSYLNEEGEIISSTFNDCEEIKFAELRMLHISNEEGVDLGWIWPLYLVDPE